MGSYSDCKLNCIGQLAEDAWDYDDFVSAWNTYCEKSNYPDDRIFHMVEIDDVLAGDKPSEILQIIDVFDFRDDYFAFTGLGYIVTFNNPFDYLSFDKMGIYRSIADDGIGKYPDLDEDEAMDYLVRQIEMDYPEFSYEEIEDAVYELCSDIFTDDWDNLVEEVVARIQSPEEE